jgi:hypothetical protein
VFDELWGVENEAGRQLFDELSPVPTRETACRLTVSYAGHKGRSSPLESLYQRGLEQPKIGPDLHAGGGVLMFWSHTPVAPWQTPAWLASMRKSMRPNQFRQLIENKWVDSKEIFIDLIEWDEIVDPDARPRIADKRLEVWAGCDASISHDSTALALVTFDKKTQRVCLVDHKIFQPSKIKNISFEDDIEALLLDWSKRFVLRSCWFDPAQMEGSSQRLTKAGVKMERYEQSLPNLTMAAENLFSLVRGRNLVVYPDEAIRTAVGHTVATATARGWKLTKQNQVHHIDVVVALSMACLAAVRAQAEPVGYDPKSIEFQRAWCDAPDEGDPEEKRRREAELERQRYRDDLMARYGRPVSLNFDQVKKKKEDA